MFLFETQKKIHKVTWKVLFKYRNAKDQNTKTNMRKPVEVFQQNKEQNKNIGIKKLKAVRGIEAGELWPSLKIV